MAGGTIELSGGGIMYGRIVWNSEPNVSTNQSRVNASLQVRKSSQYTGTTGTFSGSLSIGGSSDSGSYYGKVESDWCEVVFYAVDVSHKSDGKGSVNISGSVSGPSGTSLAGKTASGGETVTLDQIPRQAALTGAENFTDEGIPKITYSNPAGDNAGALRAYIQSKDGKTTLVSYRDIPKTESAYTFQLSAAERSALRNATPDAKTLAVKYVLECTIGTETYYDSTEKTMSILGGEPVFKPVITDESAVSELTGDAGKLVRYVSNAKVVSGAAAVKGARLVSQKIKNGSKTVEGGSGSFPAVESGEFAFEAEDSRGNTASSIVKKDIVEYVRLTCNIGQNAPDTDGNFTFALSGSYFASSFGKVSNTLTVEYRYKIEGGSYTGWILMEPRVSGDSYQASADFAGLDYQTLYIFQARATDRIGTVYTEETPIKSTPVFDWGEDDFNVNGHFSVQRDADVKGNMTVGGSLDISGGLTVKGKTYCPFPLGYLYHSSKPKSPAEIYGGTWERQEDVFILAGGSKFPPGSTGGAAAVTLGVEHIPPHKHWGVRRLNSDGGGQSQSTGTSASDKASSGWTDSTGGGQAHNNMPPYKAFYAWERIG